MENKKYILRRVYALYFLLAIVAVMIVGRVVVVQFVEGDMWREKAENLTVAYKTIDAVRGNIYDAEGGLLATSVPIYEVRWDPNAEAITDEIFNANIDTLSQCLASLFKSKTAFQWKRQLQNGRNNGARYMLIARKVKYTELKKLREFPIFKKGQFKGGLIYLQQNKRQKPFRLLAGRTIGYKLDSVAMVGLEGAYDKELKGVSGKRLMKKIMGGVWMPINDENELEPQNGYDLYTSIDINIQDVAEYALMKQLKKHDAAHGCVVLMEVETGEVRAIANLSRDDNGVYSESYNYAVGAKTEPGSTFKLASYMVALEDGYIDLDHQIETGEGVYEFYGQKMEDSKKGGYGKITVEEAFAVSSNIAIAKIIDEHYRSNPQAFIDHLYKIGLNKPLGIEIAGEGEPYIKSADDPSWSGISLPWISHGYELEMTPLQILTLYNAVANDGKMVKPMFVRSVRNGNKMVKELDPVVLNPKIASNETIEKLHAMLEAVVDHGTATNLKGAHYKIAGKTGTAQIANSKYGYHSNYGTSYQASFCGYFPADNPKYSCIVVVNAPSRNVYYGNLVAGPIFKEIADKVYSTRLEMHKELKQIEYTASTPIPVAKNSYVADLEEVYKQIDVDFIEQSEAEWVMPETKKDSVILHPKSVKQNLVPNVRGMNLEDAIYLLENMGLAVEVKGKGTVKRQSVRPGQRINKGAKITLELA